VGIPGISGNAWAIGEIYDKFWEKAQHQENNIKTNLGQPNLTLMPLIPRASPNFFQLPRHFRKCLGN